MTPEPNLTFDVYLEFQEWRENPKNFEKRK